MAHRYFEGAAHAGLYMKHRPTFPREVYQAIINFVSEKVCAPLQLAVDVGCGSGQSTEPLADHFKEVIGVDISHEQINKATQASRNNNVSYRLGSETDTHIANGSATLVTVSQSIHWFDFTKFYAEADRILAPNGCLAVYGYGNCTLTHRDASIEKKMNTLVSEFYRYLWEQGHWDSKRGHIDNHYSDIHLPHKDNIRSDSELFITRTYSLSGFIGYLESWSAYQDYKRKNNHPDKPLLIANLQTGLGSCFDDPGQGEEDTTVEVKWPIFLLMGRKTS